MADPQSRTKPSLRGRRHPVERGMVLLLFAAGVLSIAVTVGIVWELGKESLLFFEDEQVSFWDFVTKTEWLPQAGQFGIWPLVLGTMLITIIALLVAVPIGLSAAIYLSEYASARVRKIVKPTLEVLVGVPTVVFGFFAVTFMTPTLRAIFGTSRVGFFNVLSAGIVVGILVVPLISSLAEDAMAAVPGSLRQAAYALGASRLEVATRIVVPAALSGIAAGVVVAMSRAVGETMVVTLAAGASPRNFTWSDPAAMLDPFDGAQTMTGYIAITASGDLAYNTVDYNSIFAIGLALFVMTLALNSLSARIVRRYRQVYE